MTITGTLTKDDVTRASLNGLAEMLQAIRAGAAYVNVHTANFPTGEVRARLGPQGFGHKNNQ